MSILSFYKEQLIFIDRLIQEEKFSEALNIINQEFDVPFIPEEFEKQLKKRLVTISLAFNQNKLSDLEFTAHFSIKKIKQILSNDKLSAIHPFIFLHLEKYQLKWFFDVFAVYLTNLFIPNANKTLLLILLKNQDVSKTFLVKKIHFEKVVVPKKLISFEKFANTKKINKILEDHLFSYSQNILHLSKEISFHLFAYFYPIFPKEFTKNLLVASIICKTFEVLGMEINFIKIAKDFNLQKIKLEKFFKMFENNHFF